MLKQKIYIMLVKFMKKQSNKVLFVVICFIPPGALSCDQCTLLVKNQLWYC